MASIETPDPSRSPRDPTSAAARRWSLDGRLGLLVAGATVTTGAVAVVVSRWLDHAGLALLVVALVGIFLALYASRVFLRPIHSVLAALSNGVEAMRDTDYSLSLAVDRDDELGDLLRLYNEVSSAMRDERQSIYQRELLLDTVIQASPLALLLTTDRGDVIYDNAAARRWFFRGRRVAGENVEDLLPSLPPELATALRDGREGLIGVEHADEPEVFHLSHRWFDLNTRRHHLILLERLTREMNRKEVETWKKVIRLISHELRNSLGPIASLARSGRQLGQLPDPDRLARVLATIEERAAHLESFISGYARFAKLPQPRPEPILWPTFVAQLQATESFVAAGSLPSTPGHFDSAQIEQALINLLRNAREAGSPPEAIELEIRVDHEQVLIVRDRGDGMSPTVLPSALLPFYSTKRSGSGLGLPLCREIAEAHGGSLRVGNRPQGGLEVAMVLPLPRPTVAPPPRTASEEPAADSTEPIAAPDRS